MVESLRARFLATLDEALPAGDCVALLDFPSHTNVGDSAIWLGALSALRALDRRVGYTCDVDTYDPASLERAVGGGAILLTGGGNLGDLYPRHQAFRERVVEDFPERPIIQLPQSIHFADEAGLQRAGACFRSHPHLRLLVRDRRSLATAADRLGVDAVLCPDTALALGPLERTGPPPRACVWLLRDDDEVGGGGRPPDAEVHDWLIEPHGLLERGALRLRRLARERGALRPLVGTIARGTFGRLAGRRLARGLQLLSTGRAVVTDRLHGHILALMLGIPHVTIDTAQGKVFDFLDAWTGESPLVRRARSAAEAAELCATLGASGGVRSGG